MATSGLVVQYLPALYPVDARFVKAEAHSDNFEKTQGTRQEAAMARTFHVTIDGSLIYLHNALLA